MNPEHANPEHSLKRKPRAWVSFGENGHEYEYVFSTTEDGNIPSHITDTITKELGPEWEVLHRDTRIEIRNRYKLGKRDDPLVNQSIEKALGEDYTFTPVK